MADDRPASDEWPRVWRTVIDAARADCPAGHAEALAALLPVALVAVTSRGLFAPAVEGENGIALTIERIGDRHLGGEAAQAQWEAALAAAGLPAAMRGRLELTHGHVRAVSDLAHFYTGLAFGLAFASLAREG